MIKTTQEAYLAGRQAAMEKVSSAGLISLALPIAAGLGVGGAYGLYKNYKGKHNKPLPKEKVRHVGLLGGGGAYLGNKKGY